jgi:hypothetical protein
MRSIIEHLENRQLLTARLVLDYSLDTNGFFNDTARRALLQSVVDGINARLRDTLSAIRPSGQNTWKIVLQHPGNGSQHEINNPTVPADEIRVYAGGRSLPGNQLGFGGPAGWSGSGIAQSWFDTIRSRGQPGALANPATDFAPFAAAITFDSDADALWNFNTTTSGLSGKNDFLSVAWHEMFHAIGFGTSDAFQRHVNGSVFTGPASTALLGRNPPLANSGHWQDELRYNNQLCALDPQITRGTRVLPNELDWAGLKDVGWQVAAAPATLGSISGKVFQDVNASGSQTTGEANFSNVRVYVDANRNGLYESTEKSALTDAAGNYSLTNFAAGSYRIAAVAPTGWRINSPASRSIDVTLTAGQLVTGRTFALTQRVLLSGTVFNDANGDRVRQSTESLMSGVRVYLDTNNDGSWQSTERSVLTTTAGAWSFNDLVPGTYRVRIVPTTNFRLTTPSPLTITLSNGGSRTNQLFGQRRI